ncbi:MAG TPA: polysaccharide biosynthesis/export family protein [Planctomycetaceae bacterium]|nr:polysaccharide biosynthesis/export family protein [Planctomycetaceae bacterium]
MRRRGTRQRASAHGKVHSVMCLALSVTSLFGLLIAGCASPSLRDAVEDAKTMDHPRELQKVSIPPYRVEPPDILSIELVNNIRPADDQLHAGDELVIRASNLLPIDPMGDPILNEFKQINDIYRIQSDGTVDLGPEYGSVPLDGLTLVQAKEAINKHLREEVGLVDPKVAVNMPNVNGKQVVSGEHLIRPDGTVLLGIYGSVYVAGMTMEEVKTSVETQLSRSIHDPEVVVDVLAYNSKKIYVITDGGGSGETVAPLPFTGNETVLDAIGQIQGLSEVSSKRMWIARPAPNGTEIAQNMLVDWRAITQDAVTTTNYQLMPGDRIYIQADGMVAMDNFVAKVTTPFQRLFGLTLLGYSAIGRVQKGPSNSAGGGAGGGGFF